MSVSADQLRDLLALGISAELLLAIVTIFERDASRDGRALAAERARNYRARQRETGGMAAHVARETSLETSRDASRDERDDAYILSSSLLAESQQHSEEVRKKKERAPKKIAMLLPDDWQPSPMHGGKAKDMRIWAQSNGVRKVNWDATFHGFLRRAASELGGSNGHRGPRPLQDDSKSISRAAGRLAERAERGEQIWGPRPSLLPADDANPVLLLSKR